VTVTPDSEVSSIRIPTSEKVEDLSKCRSSFWQRRTSQFLKKGTAKKDQPKAHLNTKMGEANSATTGQGKNPYLRGAAEEWYKTGEKKGQITVRKKRHNRIQGETATAQKEEPKRDL